MFFFNFIFRQRNATHTQKKKSPAAGACTFSGPPSSKSASARFLRRCFKIKRCRCASPTHTHRTKRTLKFPAAKSKPWFSALTRPKPTVRTDRDRVSSRPRTNRTAHMVKLERHGDKSEIGFKARETGKVAHRAKVSVFCDPPLLQAEIRTFCFTAFAEITIRKRPACQFAKTNM